MRRLTPLLPGRNGSVAYPLTRAGCAATVRLAPPARVGAANSRVDTTATGRSGGENILPPDAEALRNRQRQLRPVVQ